MEWVSTLKGEGDEYVFFIDCELSGPMMSNHALVDLGAVFKNLNTGEVKKRFSVLINVPDDRCWDPYTVEYFWNTSYSLRNTLNILLNGRGMHIKEAMDAFVTFLCQCFVESKNRMTIAANRLDVDAAWVNLYLSLCGYYPLGQVLCNFDEARKCSRLIDSNSYHQGACWLTPGDIRKFEEESGRFFNCGVAALKMFDIKPKVDTKIIHSAVTDSEVSSSVHQIVLKEITRRRIDDNN